MSRSSWGPGPLGALGPPSPQLQSGNTSGPAMSPTRVTKPYPEPSRCPPGYLGNVSDAHDKKACGTVHDWMVTEVHSGVISFEFLAETTDSLMRFSRTAKICS